MPLIKISRKYDYMSISVLMMVYCLTFSRRIYSEHYAVPLYWPPRQLNI